MVELAELGQQLSGLRLRSPEAVTEVQRSMSRHGQLTAALAYPGPAGQLELVDGFKRFQAARAMGLAALRVRVLPLDAVHAKAAVVVLNAQGGLSELEEGWLVRSLYRDDGLTQPQIGQLLSRHKSWICRRLMLVELLDEAVSADVRLGLLAARTAVGLARLPRGNQREVAQLVMRRGLTTKQTDQLVAALLAAPDEGERRAILDRWAKGKMGPAVPGGGRSPRPSSSPAVLVALDIGQLCRVTARLEARLLERPLSSFGPEGAATIRGGLEGLRPVLAVLCRTVESVVGLSSESTQEQEMGDMQ